MKIKFYVRYILPVFPRFSRCIVEQIYYKYIDLYRLHLITLGEILWIFSEVAVKALTKVVSVYLSDCVLVSEFKYLGVTLVLIRFVIKFFNSDFQLSWSTIKTTFFKKYQKDFNPLPVQLNVLLPGLKGCVFSQGI
jgi:hypothetical protein